MLWRVAVGIGLSAWLLGGCESVPLSPTEGCSDGGTLQQPLTVTCFQKALRPVADPARDDHGQVPCRVAAAATTDAGTCDCAALGLLQADQALADFARSDLASTGGCRDACCEELCLCEVPQLSGADLDYCWDVEPEPRRFDEQPVGWCYVDPDAGFGNPELVADCRADERRRLRLLPERASWLVVLACQG